MPLPAFYRNFGNEHIKIILMIKLRNYFTLSYYEDRRTLPDEYIFGIK